MTAKEMNLSEMLFNRDNKLLDYITNLQQDLDKANDIIEKDRQFNAGRLLDIAKLKEENERLKNLVNPKTQIFIDTQDMEERYGQELYEDYLKEQLEDYKSRCEKAIELYKNCKEEDYCILSLNMYEALIGSDENE